MVDPIIGHPHTDAISLAQLADSERPCRKRRAGNVMFVADPADHAGREGLAGGTPLSVGGEHCRDLAVIMVARQGTDFVDEGQRAQRQSG